MKVLLSWLREFAPFDGDPVALGNTMSGLGMAVEDLVHIGANLDGIVVARVLEVRPHPSADRIQLVDVDAGDGNALQICCGAFNMAAGDLVPLATLGTTMSDGRTIERRKLRGQWSNGMLCSARELDISDDAEGIMILDSRVTPGAALADALGVERDVLYDLDLTGNRPDALSIAGVARDLAAKLGLPFAIAEPIVVEQGSPISGRATVTILQADADACGRFVARILDNVHIQPSPAHIANRLTLCGMRPINNVVDVSNYVMLELGRPNHTFDLRKLANGSATPGIRVRRARAGERIVTLDDVERELVASDLLICDQDDRAVGIAGVMGGANTEIDDATTSVLLEMAWFDPDGIAATARRLGLRSEASIRFERGTDYEHLELCARRFAELVAPAGFTLAPGIVDARGVLPSGAPVRVRPAKVNALLGTDLTGAEMRALLAPIGFTSSDAADDAFDVVVPSFRPDTSTETDVAEEVARHYGYDRIIATVPSAARFGELTERQQQRRRARHLLADLGCAEAMPMPFLAPGDLERAGLDGGGLVITNPLAAEESVLRTSLRPGLLRSIAYNESHRLRDVALFEIGHVYAPSVDGSEVLPAEHERVSVILAGREAPAAVDILAELCSWMGTSFTLEASAPAGLHPGRSATVYVDAVPMGEVGEIHPTVLDSYGIGGRTAWLDLDLDGLLDRAAAATASRGYVPVSRFPSSDIDLAFEVDDAVPVHAVESVLRRAAGALLVDLWLFDVFRGPPVAGGRRSLAFTLRLQAADRTLTDDEVAVVRGRCIDAVQSELPARLRG